LSSTFTKRNFSVAFRISASNAGIQPVIPSIKTTSPDVSPGQSCSLPISFLNVIQHSIKNDS
jgi:hypothetical protein